MSQAHPPAPPAGANGRAAAARDPGPAPGRAPLPAVRGWIGARLTTTPGRLGLASIAVVVAALVLGTVAFTAERSRHQAAQAVASETEPLLVEAVSLYVSLSDADATVTTTFVRGGLEPADRRTRYLDDIQAASTSLATLSRQVSTTASGRAAVSTITDGVPTYTGLVEAARAYNRQGLPVGAAYLRRASELLATSILPAANQLYETEATRLNDDYRSGVGTGTVIAFILAGLAGLALLVLLGRYLARVSHRILNVPIVAGTVISLVLFVWGIVGLAGEQSALARAQRDGSDSVEILSATRILASRAQSDESLALVSRGGDAKPAADFAAVMQALAGEEGLVAAVATEAKRTGTSRPAAALSTELNAYRVQHARIAALAAGPRFIDAVRLQVRSTRSGSSPADLLNRNLVGQIAAAQRRFAADAADATASVRGLPVAIPLLSVLAAALALIGLRQRLNEYR